MSIFRSERGGVPAPLLVAVLAVVVIGATLYFLNAGQGKKASSSTSGFQAAPPVEIQKPTFAAVEADLPLKTPESKEILKGDLIKYRDHFGNVRFRSREKVAGFNQQGETIYWNPDLQVGPSVKAQKLSKTKAIRKSGKPPRMVMRNGRAQLAASDKKPKPLDDQLGGASGAGAGGGQSGGNNAGSTPPDLTGSGGGAGNSGSGAPDLGGGN